MRKVSWLGVLAPLLMAASVTGLEQPFEYGVCLTRASIELGTYASLVVFVKNRSDAPIAVSVPQFELQTRYQSCERQPDPQGPAPFVRLKPEEIRFWSYPVPADRGFTGLLVGRYQTLVTIEVRWGEALERFVGIPAGWEDTRKPPAPPEGREILRVPLEYQIVEPNGEMALMRLQYTKEVEVCDQVDGGKQVMVHQLDVGAADRDARDQVTTSMGMEAKAVEDPHQGPAARAAREEAMYEHPAYLESLRFGAYRGTNAGNQFDYDGPLAYLDKVLAGLVPPAPAVDDLRTRTLAKFPGQAARQVSYAVTVARREGLDAALAYLRSIDTASFNCADRAFYGEFVERISRGREAATRGGGPDTPSGAQP